MLKTILLASAMAVTVPAVAQDMPQQTTKSAATAPTQDNTIANPAAVPAQQTPAAQGEPIAGAPTSDPATTPSAPATSTAPASTASATTTEPASPVTGETQIAQVVGTEFPSYDKNSDKSLDKAEFGQWMVALKSASDPATKAADPATKKWVDGAFASADTDKSKTVSQVELTKYLSQGAG
ncbi:MAG TPA: EF-hand domain-containing protein [Sphingomonas sp.]|nr:EF-hand domain-containing protein [Sphingomonas sp.]